MRELKPCGTQAGYRRHIRRGEEACDACLAANAKAYEKYFPKSTRELSPHGSLAAYRKHYRDKEEACRACKDEYNRWKYGRSNMKNVTCIRHSPIVVTNRKRKDFWECESCGVFLDWYSRGDTRKKVIERMKK